MPFHKQMLDSIKSKAFQGLEDNPADTRKNYRRKPIMPHVHNDPNFSIYIEHIPTSQTVQFDGWVTNFQDSFNSSWSSTPVYGRMDELHTFQRTGRKITLAFDVVAVDEFEAVVNQERLNALTQFLYPVYTDEVSSAGNALAKNQRVLVAPPLLKLSWASLIENPLDHGGLVGFLQGFSYQPVMEHGQYFAPMQGHDTAKILNYQNYTVHLDFTVVHTHLTGWSRASNGRYIFGGDSSVGDILGYPHRPGHFIEDTVAGFPAGNNPWVQQPEPPLPLTDISAQVDGLAAKVEVATEEVKAQMDAVLQGLNIKF